MLRRTPLRRKTPLRPGGWLKRTVARLRRRDTGPSSTVRRLVMARAGGMCEWPGCGAAAVDPHHRLARKMGGRHGDAALLLNSAANLLAACRAHHERVTSAHGEVLAQARVDGWVLREGEDPRTVPARTRHGLVLLDEYGNWRLA